MMADVQLDTAEYWELVARSERVRTIEAALAAAQEARAQLWRRLVEQYHLNATENYRLDEATRTLSPTNGNGSGAA